MAAAQPDPAFIFEYFLRSSEALATLKAALLGDPSAIDHGSRFYRMTYGEINETFRELQDELNVQIVFLLVASGEATLRIDFADRVARRMKDRASRAFRDLQRQKARRKQWVLLDEILGIWSREAPSAAARSAALRMRRFVRYRHWVAHGRYWPDKSGLVAPDPFDAWRAISRLFNTLPDFDPLPAW